MIYCFFVHVMIATVIVAPSHDLGPNSHMQTSSRLSVFSCLLRRVPLLRRAFFVAFAFLLLFSSTACNQLTGRYRSCLLLLFFFLLILHRPFMLVFVYMSVLRRTRARRSSSSRGFAKYGCVDLESFVTFSPFVGCSLFVKLCHR